MKTLPMLYARGENGKVLEWQVETDGNKFRMITGAQGFAHVCSQWSLCEGKNVGRSNETTPIEQAEAEAQAKWEKKLKHGGYWESVKDIDQTKFVEPMLANHLKDRVDKVKFPAMLDRKYNGMRQVTTSSGAFTRKGEPIYTAPHIVEALKPLFEKFPDLVLDGELYNHDYRYKLNELIKLVRKSKHFTDVDLKRSEEIVKYYVYDGYGFDFKSDKGGVVTEETGCFQRRQCLKDLLKDIPFVEVVSFFVVHDIEEVYSIYQTYVDDGYEGAIFRTSDAPYQHKRSNDLLKVKPEDDDEGMIKNISEGTGNWSGTGKIITLEWKDKVFDATFKGTYEQGVQFLKDKSTWIGRNVTFLYNGLTGKGVPNYARVDIDNCFKGDR